MQAIEYFAIVAFAVAATGLRIAFLLPRSNKNNDAASA